MPQRILKIILVTMLVALLFINVNTVINVNYVRAEEPTTQTITDNSEKIENENNIELTDNSIQENLTHISNNLNYMLIMQILSLGAFLGYVAIDRLR